MKVKVKLNGCQHQHNIPVIGVGQKLLLSVGRNEKYVRVSHQGVTLGYIRDSEFLKELLRLRERGYANRIYCKLASMKRLGDNSKFFRTEVEFDLPVVLEEVEKGFSLWEEYVSSTEKKEDLFLAGLETAFTFATKEEVNAYIVGYKKGKSSICQKPHAGK